jgi:predicted RNA-binding protein with TRAM domain
MSAPSENGAYVGVWSRSVNGAHETLCLRADGTYRQAITMSTVRPDSLAQREGVWILVPEVPNGDGPKVELARGLALNTHTEPRVLEPATRELRAKRVLWQMRLEPPGRGGALIAARTPCPIGGPGAAAEPIAAADVGPG